MSSLPSVASASDPSSADMSELLHRQQIAFRSDMSPSRTVREDRLRRLARLIDTHSGHFPRDLRGLRHTLGHRDPHHRDHVAAERHPSCTTPPEALDEIPARRYRARLSAGPIQ